MNQIALSPNFLESAYSRSMSTTKIILIISSSTKIIYLEDIYTKHRELLDGEKVRHFLLMISGVVVKKIKRGCSNLRFKVKS